MRGEDRGEPRGPGRAGHPGPRAVRGGAPLVGEARLPGSKSLAIRALLAASLAAGRTRVTNLSEGQDVAAALGLIEAAGADLTRLAPRAVAVVGRPPGPHRGWAPTGPLEAGESGTLARLASAVLGLAARAPGPYELRVSGTLARRASPPLFRALAQAGVGLEPAAAGSPEGGWPVRIRPIGPPPLVTLREPVSSQEVSALLLALAAWPGESRLAVEGPVPSRPYLDLTVHTLARFGARVDLESAVEGVDARSLLVVRGPLAAPPEPFAVEPDASAAAVVLAAACLSGGEVRASGLGPDSPQGDRAIAEHLRAFGCGARFEGSGLVARGRPTCGAELDLVDVPDLAPVLAAVAGAVALRAAAGELDRARARSRLVGLSTLEGKESPRLSVLAGALGALGLEVEVGPGELVVAPPAAPPAARALALDPHGDHRMAFAFALLGLVRPGLSVSDPGCVAKSWPGFWEELERLAADRGAG